VCDVGDKGEEGVRACEWVREGREGWRERGRERKKDIGREREGRE